MKKAKPKPVRYPTKRERLYPRPKKAGYKEQYGLTIICDSEPDQKRLYVQLKKRWPRREIKVVAT